MTPEIREAAERLRSPDSTGNLDDLVTLARAYLAEHPADDDEPITRQWCGQIGGELRDNTIKVRFHRDDSLPVGLWHVGDGWKAMLELSDSAASCIVRGLETRGQLRKLAAVLGIKLEKGGG